MKEDQQIVVNLATKLGEIVLQGAAESISQKTKSIKTKKEIKDIHIAYDEIISDLLLERGELIAISRQYQEIMERAYISDEDIDHLHNTINTIISILLKDSPEQKRSLETLVGLLNKDTLRTMQLIGFNYRDAIGKPLTDLCAHKIQSLSNKKQSSKKVK